jgi:hypothetical protein
MSTKVIEQGERRLQFARQASELFGNPLKAGKEA